jgi:hypothetical protein
LDVPASRPSWTPFAEGPAEDAFMRIWRTADESYAQHVQAIAELRERKRRQDAEAPGPRSRQLRWLHDVPGRAMPVRQRAEQLPVDAPIAFPARAGWFLLRMGAYGLIGLTVFACVGWLFAR